MTIVTVFIGALLANVVGKAALEFYVSWKFRPKPGEAARYGLPDRAELDRMRERHQALLELNLAALDIGVVSDEVTKTALVEAASKFARLTPAPERLQIELDLQRTKSYTVAGDIPAPPLPPAA